MTNLRDKIAYIIRDDKPHPALTPLQKADAILALPETAGWTALEGATEALANAEDRIEELQAKLAEVTAERDMDLSNHHNAAKCPYCNPTLQSQIADIICDEIYEWQPTYAQADAILALPEIAAWKARAEAAEAMLPRAYRAGLEEASDHILKTQIGFEEKGNDWVKGNNSGVKGSAHAIRALRTPTSAELVAMLKETQHE